MSKYISGAKMVASLFDSEKAHSSITDWVEILSSDKYEEDSMDGIPELVEAIRIQGQEGITESSRALRKKLKYGNVHRQIRAFTMLRALTENSGKNYQHSFMNPQLHQRLKEMATDSLTDPKVKRKMISVFHAWSLAYGDDARMREVAGLYAQYSGKKTIVSQQPSRRSSVQTGNATSATPAAPTKPASNFEDLEHSWAPTHKSSAADYADLAAAREAANQRQAERDRQAAIEAREAELERRERALKNKEADKLRSQEASRLAYGEEERRRKEAAEKAKKAKEPKRPPFVFEKEKPQVIVAIANANQAASNLVNALRLVNREKESVTTNIKVLDYLEKAKVARRPIIRYIQVVIHEEFVGTLLNANEQIVEAIQLYDKLSKPMELDSDSDHEDPKAKKEPKSDREMEQMRRRLEAQKLEDDRKGELQRMQEKQKLESQRMKERRAAAKAAYEAEQKRLDEEEAAREREYAAAQKGRRTSQAKLPPPITPDDVPSRRESYDFGSLSDFSDYDSSDEEYRRQHSRGPSRRGSTAVGTSKPKANYATLDDDDETPLSHSASTGAYDPFADPDGYLDSIGGGNSSGKKKERMEWAAI